MSFSAYSYPYGSYADISHYRILECGEDKEFLVEVESMCLQRTMNNSQPPPVSSCFTIPRELGGDIWEAGFVEVHIIARNCW